MDRVSKRGCSCGRPSQPPVEVGGGVVGVGEPVEVSGSLLDRRRLAAGVLESATYGVLGSTTNLGY
jgi:hypothetical protein